MTGIGTPSIQSSNERMTFSFLNVERYDEP